VDEKVSTGVDGLDPLLEGGFPRGSVILVAGSPGTGKTVLSAQFIVRGADVGEPGIYVSFTEDRDRFIRNMSRHLGRDLKGLEDQRKISILDLSSVKGEGVSANVELILDEVESLQAKRLVIDSFSAMTESFKEPLDVRAMARTVLGRLPRRMGCTTIVIEEVPTTEPIGGLGPEEFVSDGIIVLRRKWFEERFLRELEIVKMRGVAFEESRLVFTLKGGLRAFPPAKPKPIEKPRPFEPIQDTHDKFSTGIGELDQVLGGGYPKGSGVLFEVAEKISTTEYHMLAGPVVMNSLAQGRGVILVPTIGVDPEFLRIRAPEYGATEEEMTRLARVCVPAPIVVGKPRPSVVVFEGKDLQKDYEQWLRVEQELIRQTGCPVLCVTGLDTLVSLYGPEACERVLSADIARIRNRGAIAILIAKPGNEMLVRKLGAMAEVHLKLEREHGSLLLHGVKPRTSLLAVEADTSKGYLMPKLTPIV